MRLAVGTFLTVVPLLIGFAPTPPPRSVNDPDHAIQQFEQQLLQCSVSDGKLVADRKRRLIDRLDDLHSRLSRQGDTTSADAVRDRLALVRSLDGDRPLGELSPAQLLRQASGDGKYQHLLRVVYSPADRTCYAPYQDFGFWNGSVYAGQTNLPPGHWVYVQPRWFIWREGPPK